ncbi:glutamate synthase subunit beta [Algisphaera agarilytica]|uniref:NAD(P)H-dependent glutamate synthase small subunit n=1 Tax=Algisphaera agarilytica TaxID=1385975 RepID=A0A7X0H8T2_9BACT|nr:glutamate synthase subunit beta [Algisphaera agarilytica]MBB6431248.1 NAD(P)H-dependent glutamate synthase small subunit [Algisphaera agarilytica]
MPITKSPNHQIAEFTVMPSRDSAIRLNDYYEVYTEASPEAAKAEGERCFNCGAAFCMPDSGYGQGCPIQNKIPEWNELVRLDRWKEAYHRLSETNPFPEFTSRVCPAPCQDACILGINEKPVQIKGIERAIIDRAFDEGWVIPAVAPAPTGKRVAVIGSGPAGLAAADTLCRLGHEVTVFERSDRPGGLLTYGVPNMKLDKSVVFRRIDLMMRSGVNFRLNANIGQDINPQQLTRDFDSVLLAVGAQRARSLDVPGMDLPGVINAMDYLTASARQHLDASGPAPDLDAAGKDVIVIGGGDTGADCIGTALRQGCRSLLNITRREQPPDERPDTAPWPGPPNTYTLDYAHAEGVTRFGRDPREYQVQPLSMVGDTPIPSNPGGVSGVEVLNLADQTKSILPADLVLLAIGFVGHDTPPLAAAFGLETDKRGRLTDQDYRSANQNVYVAGDCRRGASLVVWAIHEGLAAARAIHRDLQSVV